MSRRIGQRRDDFQLLDDGARPAMGDNQRQCVRVTRADMDEVNVHAVDGGDELRQVHSASLRSCASRSRCPNSAPAPAALRAARLVRLIVDRLFVGPTGHRDAPAEIGEVFIRDVDPERTDCFVFTRSSKLPGHNTDSTCQGCNSQKIPPRWRYLRPEMVDGHDVILTWAGQLDPMHQMCWDGDEVDLRSGLNAARISEAKSCGCSQAAK